MSTSTLAAAPRGDTGGQRGEETAALFKRHDARLRAVVRREVRTARVNVEDACAFAWLQLCRRQPRSEGALAWLCRTAIREAVKLDRRSRRSLVVDRADALCVVDVRSLPEDRIELIGARQAVAAAGLREREAQLVALRAAGYSYREASLLTGQSLRTVERQLGRATRKLRDSRRAELDES